MGQAERGPDLPRSASNVLGPSPILPFFNRVAGQVKVTAGQVNFRGSLPCSENNDLQPMLLPKSVRSLCCWGRPHLLMNTRMKWDCAANH